MCGRATDQNTGKSPLPFDLQILVCRAVWFLLHTVCNRYIGRVLYLGQTLSPYRECSFLDLPRKEPKEATRGEAQPFLFRNCLQIGTFLPEKKMPSPLDSTPTLRSNRFLFLFVVVSLCDRKQGRLIFKFPFIELFTKSAQILGSPSGGAVAGGD